MGLPAMHNSFTLSHNHPMACRLERIPFVHFAVFRGFRVPTALLPLLPELP